MIYWNWYKSKYVKEGNAGNLLEENCESASPSDKLTELQTELFTKLIITLTNQTQSFNIILFFY
jgi:hypothetical protein